MALFGFGKDKKGDDKKAEEKRDVKPVEISELQKKEKPVVKKEVKKEAGTKEEVKKIVKAEASVQTDVHGEVDLAGVLKRPRVTEKATIQSEDGVYVFEIDLRANKKDVAAAVKRFYKVTPRKVNIVKIPRKKVSSRKRGKFGQTSGSKKAYVYLKDGDSIQFV